MQSSRACSVTSPNVLRASQPKPARRAPAAGGLRARFTALWRALRGQGSPRRLGVSVGVGLFIGCQPLYGLHLPLCVLVCLPFRLDAVVAYLAANISNPLVAPLLLFIEVEIGSLVLHGVPVAFDLAAARQTGITGFVEQAAVGSLILGSALGLVGGSVAAFVAGRGKAASPLALAQRRTRARYATSPPAHRYYVAAKLRTDPVLTEVSALGELGDVVDAGAGRGQLGLCLLELGRVRSLAGFDFDPQKVDVARAAAAGDAEFRVADLLDAELGEADTVLFIDVLHYLAPSDQDRLLARAVASLRPGGRLLVRETDGEPGARSALTRGLERWATRVGYNRVAAQQKLGFRPLGELVAEMNRLGLDCQLQGKASGARLGNRLIVGQKR